VEITLQMVQLLARRAKTRIVLATHGVAMTPIVVRTVLTYCLLDAGWGNAYFKDAS